MRIETYFRQIEKIIDACPVIQLSNVTYEKLGLATYPHHKHDGLETRVIPSAAPNLTTVLQEVELVVPLP